MKTLSLILALFVSGCSSHPNGFRFRIAFESEKLVVTQCDEVPAFDTYLAKLNEAMRDKSRECIHTDDPSPTSHSIECRIVNGPIEATMMWHETKEECQSARALVKGE